MRRRLLFVLMACLALVASACDTRLIDPPGPAGQTRYRDEIFTAVTKTADITYGQATNQKGELVTLKLDLYQPTGDTAATRPAIIFVHGGSFAFGTKTSPEIVDEANAFARKGYVVASISYRLSDGGCGGITVECITSIRQAREDAQAAVRYMRRRALNHRVDINRIAIAGTSAGAITALEVAYGPEDVGNSGNPGYPSTVRAAVSFSGAKILSTPNPGEAAALLLHGTADTLVPYQWAVNTVTAAEAAGLHVELTTWEGDGHVPYVQHRDQIIDETTNFLWWTMNLQAAAV